MNCFIKRHFVALLLLTVVSYARTQTVINYTNASTAGGLRGDWVLDIQAISPTQLLIATGNGVSTYDISAGNWGGIGNTGTISRACLYDGTTANYWAGNFNMAVKYNGMNTTNYTQASGLAGDNCQAIAKEASGIIWLGSFGTSSGGLTKYDGTNLSQYYVANGLPSNSISGLSTQGNDLWIATFNGISKLSNGTFTNYSIANGLPANDIRDIYVSGSTIWMATAQGISQFDGTTFTNYTTADGLVSNDAYSVTTDIDGIVWIGTTGGVSKFDGITWTNYTTATGLSSNDIRTIFATPTAIWIGTGGSGMDRISINPTMEVSSNNNPILDGATATSTNNGTDLGNTQILTGSSEHQFTIRNTGNTNLHLNGAETISISGIGALDYSVNSLPQTVIAPDQSTTFSILFHPASLGLSEVTITISNDDQNNSPFDFSLVGNGQDSEIEVQSNDEITIVNGDLTPTTTDHTDFGSLDINTGASTYSFLIRNYGEFPLSLTGTPEVAVSGTDASDFTVTVTPANTIPGGGQFTSFNLTFNPSGSGVKTATISIANNDIDEGNYSFAVQGTGTGIAGLSSSEAAIECLVYPNPVNDQLNILATDPIQLLQLFSANGTLVFEQALSQPTYQLDCSNQKSGWYYLKVITASATSTHPFCKQ